MAWSPASLTAEIVAATDRAEAEAREIAARARGLLADQDDVDSAVLEAAGRELVARLQRGVADAEAAFRRAVASLTRAQRRQAAAVMEPLFAARRQDIASRSARFLAELRTDLTKLDNMAGGFADALADIFPEMT